MSIVLNNIKIIYLIDVNGREFEFEKKSVIDIENFSKGTYLIKIVMNDGSVQVDKLIKI